MTPILQTLILLIFALLGSLTASAQTQYDDWYLQRPDGDIFVREVGTGKDLVVVLHGGFGANHDYMLDSVRGLEKDFRFVFFDQRGSLLSPMAKENLTFDKNVEDVAELVRALRIPKVKILAHSMGTLVAMELQKRHPDLVSNLVLVGAIFPKVDSIDEVFSERMKKQANQLQQRKEVQELLEPYLNKGYNSIKSLEDIGKSPLSHRDLTDVWRIRYASVNVYDIRKHRLVKGGRAFYKGEGSAMSDSFRWKYDFRESLAANGKVTFIQGDHDYLDFNAETLRKQLDGFPSVRLMVIANAGHNVWIDSPARFREGLRNSLYRRPPSK